MGEFWRYFVRLDRRGSARLIADPLVDHETNVVRSTGLCLSDDPHIVALARVSGARVLCSNDDALCADFKNPRLLAKPRGKIYRYAEHSRLIKTACKNLNRSYH